MTLLYELLEQNGTKVVVFSQWLRMHELLVRRFEGRPWKHILFHGGVPGHKLGMPPKPVTAPAEPEGVMNKTDHDSRMMRTQGQPTVQGYNAQAAVTRGQIIVAAEIAVESPDFGHLEPAVRTALRELDDAGITQRPETVLGGRWLLARATDGEDRR